MRLELAAEAARLDGAGTLRGGEVGWTAAAVLVTGEESPGSIEQDAG
jgi:hypothetical protein